MSLLHLCPCLTFWLFFWNIWQNYVAWTIPYKVDMDDYFIKKFVSCTVILFMLKHNLICYRHEKSKPQLNSSSGSNSRQRLRWSLCSSQAKGTLTRKIIPRFNNLNWINYTNDFECVIKFHYWHPGKWFPCHLLLNNTKWNFFSHHLVQLLTAL